MQSFLLVLVSDDEKTSTSVLSSLALRPCCQKQWPRARGDSQLKSRSRKSSMAARIITIRRQYRCDLVQRSAASESSVLSKGLPVCAFSALLVPWSAEIAFLVCQIHTRACHAHALTNASSRLLLLHRKLILQIQH